jgi:DNA methyltransferase 1-associated protein 1
MDVDGPAPKEEDVEDSHFAKFKVKVNVPTYTDEQYDANLRNEDWSREETDYLMELVRDFDLRWPVIWDRYEYQPGNNIEMVPSEIGVMVPHRKVRTLEDLKARYYDVAAKMMAIHHPVQFMSQAEFNLHQLMTSFNPQQEQQRKQFAEVLMSRSIEERREEESLLIELKRILARSEKLQEERKELYARLESPPSQGNVGIYSTSAGLAQLLQQLMNANKSKQRKSILGPEGVSPATAGPSGQQPPASLDRRESSVRESISGPSASTPTTNKKGSIAVPTERRKLVPEEEKLYGVSYHERLTGGPVFRHDKVNKLISGKSAVQAQKFTNMLNELSIPSRLTMPTAEVTTQYEQLVTSISTLLEARKMVDKLEAEMKLAEAQKAEREKKERRDQGEPEEEEKPTLTNGEVVDGDAAASSAVAEDGEGDEQGEKEASAGPGTRNGTLHKRSASVLSQVSDKSAKRQKK